MFTMNELEPYYEMAATIEINGMIFTITKVEDLSGVHAVWVSDNYRIYATPYFENIPIPVDVRDCNDNEIDTDGYLEEVGSFECYCKNVKILAEKVLRSSL